MLSSTNERPRNDDQVAQRLDKLLLKLLTAARRAKWKRLSS
jgi:hypothetical protein